MSVMWGRFEAQHKGKFPAYIKDDIWHCLPHGRDVGKWGNIKVLCMNRSDIPADYLRETKTSDGELSTRPRRAEKCIHCLARMYAELLEELAWALTECADTGLVVTKNRNRVLHDIERARFIQKHPDCNYNRVWRHNLRFDTGSPVIFAVNNGTLSTEEE